MDKKPVIIHPAGDNSGMGGDMENSATNQKPPMPKQFDPTRPNPQDVEWGQEIKNQRINSSGKTLGH